jgi:hypothetical protein
LVATLEQVFREEWGRVLATVIGFLGDRRWPGSPGSPHRSPGEERGEVETRLDIGCPRAETLSALEPYKPGGDLQRRRLG